MHKGSERCEPILSALMKASRGDRLRKQGADTSQSSGSDHVKFFVPSLSSKSDTSGSCQKDVPLPTLLLQGGMTNEMSLAQRTSASTDRHRGRWMSASFRDLARLDLDGVSAEEVVRTAANASHSGLGQSAASGAAAPAVHDEIQQPHVETGPPLQADLARLNLDTASAAEVARLAEDNGSHAALLQNAASGAPVLSAADEIQQLHVETGLPMADLQALANHGILAKIPRNGRGEISSLGSIGHSEGSCSPCLFWFRRQCAKGLYCTYCHLYHKGQKKKRIRPSKKTREQMRAAGQEEIQDDDEQ